MEHSQKVMGIYKKAIPKYIELEKRFKAQSEQNETEVLKKKLLEIKELHKPIDHKDID
jgi:hypothetical protein